MISTPTPSSRHPFEIFMLVLCVLSGLTLLLGNPAPTSIQALMPGWAVAMWGLLLCGGAAVALAGCILSHRIIGVVIEQIGLVATGAGALIYGLCIAIIVGSSGMFAGALTVGFGASCLWRWYQLQRLFAAARAVQAAVGPPR